MTEAMANPVSPTVNRRTTLKDALSMMLDADVQTGIVVDRTGAALGLLTDRGRRRPDARGRSCPGVRPGRPAEGGGRDEPAAGAPGASDADAEPRSPRPERVDVSIDWAWVASHVDAMWRTLPPASPAGRHRGRRRLRHLARPRDLGLSGAGRSTPGSSSSRGLLYTIPSLAAFALLRPITGLTLATAVIPLTTYTLLILVRANVPGFDSVPADVLEAAEGMGYTRRERLLRVELPLALPLIMAGIRLATVTTIGLATVASILGETFGGFGFFITEGLNRFFLTEIYVGAVLSIGLAFGADFLLVRLERRMTPWARARAERADGRRHRLVPRSGPLSGAGSIPQRLFEHILLCAAALLTATVDRPAGRPVHRPYPTLRR